MPSSVVSIPVDKKAVIERGLVAPKDTADIVDNILVNLRNTATYRNKGYLSLGEILMFRHCCHECGKWMEAAYILGDYCGR